MVNYIFLTKLGFMLIGALSRNTGISRDTIRFYEKIGLFHLSAFQRKENNYKDYGEEIFERIGLIQSLKSLGFSLREMKKFFAIWENHASCENLLHAIGEKLTACDEQILKIKNMKKQLQKLAKRCKGKDCRFEKSTPECLCKGTGCC